MPDFFRSQISDKPKPDAKLGSLQRMVGRLRLQLAHLVSRADYVCAHRYGTDDPVGTRIIAVSDLAAETQRARKLLIETIKEIPVECDCCGGQHYIADNESVTPCLQDALPFPVTAEAVKRAKALTEYQRNEGQEDKPPND